VLYQEVLSIFPEKIRELLRQLNINISELQEIRVRSEKPMFVKCKGQEYATEQVIKKEQVGELLAYLSSYSLYAYEDEIRQGFLSLPGGHRVGLAGKVIIENRKVKTITEISSLNIRLAHEKKGCADNLIPKLWEKERLCHTLIASAPGRGKTTLLRDCIRQISNGSSLHSGMTVSVVDERSEIAGCFRGVPGNDLGLRTDVLDACPKAEGMMMLIRSLAPDVVAVDEIGSRDDLEALHYAMNCGCVLLATVHGSSMEELRQKPILKEIIELALFERYVFLDNGKIPGRIGKILDKRGQALKEVETIC